MLDPGPALVRDERAATWAEPGDRLAVTLAELPPRGRLDHVVVEPLALGVVDGSRQAGKLETELCGRIVRRGPAHQRLDDAATSRLELEQPGPLAALRLHRRGRWPIDSTARRTERVAGAVGFAHRPPVRHHNVLWIRPSRGRRRSWTRLKQDLAHDAPHLTKVRYQSLTFLLLSQRIKEISLNVKEGSEKN
jgi:hypothetical protein